MLAELSVRTDASWIQQLVTCFADDTHLAWRIDGPADLDFVCRSLRAAFQLLQECHMVVNSDKSSVVIGLKGSYAKRWLREHTVSRSGRKCIDFGVPGDSLCIPQVESFTYLGVIVSYKQYELQTLLHRIQAASANRARLNKLLHSRQIATKRRVSLYLSCIRSTLLFGLYAVGVTDSVLRRLEAADARHVRSVARSPVHLTHESNESLRRRLGISGPARDLIRLVDRRAKVCSDPGFTAALAELGTWLMGRVTHLESATGTDATLQPCLPTQGIACPECGLYFDCTRTMHSHLARKHGCPAVKLARPKAKAYTRHTRDGMPHCRHCDRIFTRVEALKKHLQGSCPVLHHAHRTRQDTERSATDLAPTSVACGAAGAEEPLGHSCRVPAAGTESASRDSCEVDEPLFDRQSFRSQLRCGWRQVLKDPLHLSKLKEHCVFCNQWLSVKGPGVKQHHRLAHPERWTLKEPIACAQQRDLGHPAVHLLCRRLQGPPSARAALSSSVSGGDCLSCAPTHDNQDGRGGHGPLGGSAGDEIRRFRSDPRCVRTKEKTP